MSWIVIALAAAAVSALVNILDKTVLYRYARTPGTLPLMIGVVHATIGTAVVVALPFPEGATRGSVAWALGSGALFGLAGQALLRVLYTQEVSRTIPVFQTFPIFTALLAVLFLDERLGVLGWLAVVTTVTGAVALTLQFDSQYRRLFVHRSFFLLTAGSVVAATAHIAAKVAVGEMPVVYTHGLRMLALGLVFLGFSARPAAAREVWSFVRARRSALALVGLNEAVVANAGLLLTLWAIALGPVSLATALVATRSFFVVLYSLGLAFVWRGFLGEQTSRGAVTVKLASTVLIVVGVAAVTVQ